MLTHFKDPAPSKFFYKLNRLAYKLWFKLLLSAIVFSALILLARVFIFEKLDLNKSLLLMKNNAFSYFEDIAEFKVRKVEVFGASGQLTLEIEDLVENTLSRKISKLSVTDLREKIINIKRVKNAVVKFSINGYIQVEVIERRGLAVYSEGKSYMVLDEEGIRISHYNEWRKVPNLPLVVGKGADGKLSDFILMQGNLQSLVSEIEFYEWVGERRWNLHFKNKLIVKLPESNLGEGLNFLFALRERKFLNNYEVIMIDLRNLDKPFIKFRDDLTREKYSEVL